MPRINPKSTRANNQQTSARSTTRTRVRPDGRFRAVPRGVAIVEEATLVKGPEIEEGAEYEEGSPLGPFDSKSHWRVTEFDPPRRQVHVDHLPFGPVELTIETRPDGDGGTILDHTVELTAFPRVRPLGWLLERVVLVRTFASDMEESLAAFAELVREEQAAK